MYDFNLLVSCPWSLVGGAKGEIVHFLKLLGDEKPVAKPTAARGIVGVKTDLDARYVVSRLKTFFQEDPTRFHYTLKWVPIDLWVNSDLESMRKALMQVRDMVKHGERWRMTVEKRRYALYHRIDIIKALAELIDEKVDLKNPGRIVRLDIIGKNAGLSVLSPEEIFSIAELMGSSKAG